MLATSGRAVRVVNAYDEVAYPGRPYPQTHPDRLAAVAILAGMAPAPVASCRVLEVGCGDAANLIPMAHGLPDSQFVGVDLAARPIARGTDLARALGLKNLVLETLDLAAFPPDAGTFDYIIVHGVYSWIPAAARERLFALLAGHLAPAGVACVSYNTYPGCYVRRMVWEMLRFHTDHLADPHARIDEATALARLLATGRRVHDASGAQLKLELENLLQRDPAHLFHDDLAEINEPVYFHELNEQAQRHGLQYLGDAELAASGYGSLTASARRLLEGLDPITREQYLDFVLCRRFRQSLLCHAGRAIDRAHGAERITQLFLAARGRVAGPPRPSDEVGALPDAEAGSTRDAAMLLRALLDAVEEAAPRRLTFDEVTAIVGAGESGRCLRERGRDFFRDVALGAARAGAVLVHAAAPRLTTAPGDRPLASPIARHQVAAGAIVTTLCHDSVKVDHEGARRLLPLLDGTRTRRALVAALGRALDGDDSAARLASLDAHLQHLARLGLLLA